MIPAIDTDFRYDSMRTPFGKNPTVVWTHRYRSSREHFSPSLSRLDGQLRLAFCPTVFRSGVSSCPADVSLVAGALVVRLRGVVEFQEIAGGAVGQVHFDEPLERRDFDALREACQIDAAFA